MLNLIKLWLATFIIGLVFFPMISIIFKKFNDKGWLFSKVIGVCISAWAIWLLAYIKLVPYSQISSYLIILLFAIINGLIFYIRWKNKKIEFNKKDVCTLLKNILASEIIFIICICFWFYIKGFSPEINNQTEQFMDYGYMNSIMNSKYMPPQDIWLSGMSINYYYFGQYISGFLCKLAGLTATEGYYLIISFIATFTFVLPFSIAYNLFKLKFESENKTSKIITKILTCTVAICIGLSASIGGTLHYPVYKWFNFDKENYTFYDEVRYIGYKPEVDDKTATEVPAYSSLLGDLHAHYIDLVFTLTTIALLAAFFLRDEKDSKSNKYLSYFNIGLIAFMLGISKLTNYWDFPIYLVIISSIIICKKIICDKCNRKSILSTLLILILIVFIEELITLPFTLDLVVNSTKICFTGIMSPFYKLIIKWGLPTICVFAFLIIHLIDFKKSSEKFKDYLNNHLEDLFIIILGLCAFGLVLMPEIIYLKDIYGDDYKRFNTMFKLTYQAYILFSITTFYILFKLSLHKNKFVSYIAIILVLINITTIGYGINAINMSTNNVEHKTVSADNAMNYIRSALPDDFEAIEWINNNVDKNKIIVESTRLGNSYSTSSRISTFTGNPTVLGWIYHEWIWRSNADYSIPEELTIRNTDIQNLYEASSVVNARQIINKYNIDYIYIGHLEYETYYNLNVELLKQLGDVVYNNSYIYLIKVK